MGDLQDGVLLDSGNRPDVSPTSSGSIFFAGEAGARGKKPVRILYRGREESDKERQKKAGGRARGGMYATPFPHPHTRSICLFPHKSKRPKPM